MIPGISISEFRDISRLCSRSPGQYHRPMMLKEHEVKKIIYVSTRENMPLESSTRSNTKRAAQSQKLTRVFKFRIQKVEGLYSLFSENKGTDQRLLLDIEINDN